MTQIAETCALSRTIFEAWNSFRVTCAKPGGNAGKTLPVSRTRCSALLTMQSASGAGARAWVQVRLFRHTPAGRGGCDSADDSSIPAIARLGFSGVHIVMGCRWHDIRITTDAGGHWRNISSELPASVSKWAKSYNLSRSLPPTGQPVLFKRPARYTRAYSRRRSRVSRQSKMTILRPDFFSRKPFLQS